MERLDRYAVYDVPLTDIWVDGDFNCRNAFTFQSVKGLADNIAQTGLEIPVILQRKEDSEVVFAEPYRLVAGFRRLAAVKSFLKWPNIPANIRIGLADRQAEILNLTENLERQDLNPLEQAQALVKRFPEGSSLRTIGKEMNRDTKWVHQRLRIMQLPEELREKVAAKILSLLDVDILVALPPEEQIDAANQIIAARGKRKRKLNVNPKFRRKFKYRRGKEEINRRTGQLLEAGLSGLATKCLAWCAGYMSDDDLDLVIEQELVNNVGEISPISTLS
jgi:ParB/RepB/Spo0J family partition protein